MSLFPPGEDHGRPDHGEDREEGRADSLRRPRRRGRWVLGLLTAIAALLVLAVVLGTSYVATVSSSVSQNLERGDELPPEIPVDPAEAPRPARPSTPAAAKAVNYLLLGSDSRTGRAGQGRSDVLMVLHLAGDRKSAALVSFPRDLYVAIPGHGKDKTNAAFALGGTALAVRTVEGLTGTRMDHVAVVDFAGFIALTDQLGGVTLDNPNASVSQGYSFPTGRITVRGAEALAYVREREQLPRGDLDRAERQRLVAQAVLAKGLSRETLLDPRAFNAFAGGLARSVIVDADLTVPELRRTALSVRFRPGTISSLQAPITGFGTSPDGQSIDVLDADQMRELGAALRQDRLADYLVHHPAG